MHFLSTMRLSGAMAGILLTGCALVAEAAPAPDAMTAPAPSTAVNIVPLRRAQPIYPHAALARGIQGCVKVRFDIDRQGRPTNLQVWTHYPSGAFDQAAIQTVARWRFRVTSTTGKTATAKDVFQEIDFAISRSRRVSDTLGWLCRQPRARTLIVAAATAPGAQRISIVPKGDRVDLVGIPAPPDRLTSGWIKEKFCVDASGQVTGVRTLAASPRGLYDAVAVRAMQTWKFSPRKAGGRAVKTCGLHYTIPVIARSDLAHGPVAVAQGPLALDMQNLGSARSGLPLHGKVRLRFCVDADGSISDVHILASRPGHAFEDAAINTVHAWSYWPREIRGKAVRTCNVTQSIVFKTGHGGLAWGDPRRLINR